jgi:hypothetical protein
MTARQRSDKLAIPHFEQLELNKKVDADELRKVLSHQTRRSGEVRFKDSFSLVQKIKKGLHYKLSLAPANQSPPQDVPDIRYGLIVQDIIPSQAPALAALEYDYENRHMYTRPAKVIYSIDKLSEDRSPRLVLSPVPGTYESEISYVGPAAHVIFKKPSTDFDLNIDAADADESVSSTVGSGSAPGAKVTLTQADGLWSTQLVTKSSATQDNMTHEVKVPVCGEASFTRKFDSSFKAIKTSANNVLGSTSAPKVHVHHLASQNRYAGEFAQKKNSLEWGLVVEPRVGWQPGESVSKTGDKVSIRIANSF